MHFTHIRAFLAQTSFFFALLTGFFIPISTAATNIGVGLTLLFYILSGQLMETHAWLKKQSIAWAAFALLVCLFMGIFYSLADNELIITFLIKYLKFFVLLIFLPLIYQHIKHYPQHCTWGFNVFLAALFVTLILSYALFWFEFNLSFMKGNVDNPVPFKNYISQSILMAFASYACLIIAQQAYVQRHTKKAIIWLIISLFFIYNVLFMLQGRTGYGVLFALLLLWVFSWAKWRGLLWGCLTIVVLLFSMLMFSSTAQDRLSKIGAHYDAYQAGDTDHSLGKRLEYYRHSFALWTERPIFGYGTGAFSVVYENRVQALNLSEHTRNPHNEYLIIAVQWGIFGLLAFLAFLGSLYYQSRFLNPPYRALANGLLLTIITSALLNSVFLDFTEGYAFVYLIAVIYAAGYRENTPDDKIKT
jgi:O-antigen ligase